MTGKKRKRQKSSRSDRELKKFEFALNYCGSRGLGGIQLKLNEALCSVVECKRGK